MFESVYGINLVIVVLFGYKVVFIDVKDDGMVDLDKLKIMIVVYDGNIVGIMLINLNICGLFEWDVKIIVDLIYVVGGFFYCDGVNFNVIVGKVCLGDFGVDVMYINLYKMFLMFYGGGGLGFGLVVLLDKLVLFVLLLFICKMDVGFELVEMDVVMVDGE